MHGKGFLVAAMGLVVVAVAAALLTVGGPTQGKNERFDLLRLTELRQIAQALRCASWRDPRPVLPDQLTPESLGRHCPSVPVEPEALIDNETGAAYVYRREDDRAFAVCATFHDAIQANRLDQGRSYQDLDFDPDSGCVIGRVS